MPSKISHNTLILSSIVSILYTDSTWSDSNYKNLFDMDLEELLQVKISGVALREENPQDTPASINIFNHQAIQTLGVTTLIELMRFVPGFQTFRSDDSSRNVVGIRGRLISTSSREVLLIVDGVRMEEWWSGASIYSFAPYSLEGVERVEFIRGPVSHIYGSNAFTGVINVITGKASRRAKMEIGNLGHTRVSGSFQKEVGEATHFLTIDNLEQDGQSYNIIDPYNASNSLEISDPIETLKMGYTLSWKDWSLLYNYMKNDNSDFFVSGGAHEKYSYTNLEQYNISIQHSSTWNREVSTHISTGYKSYENDFGFALAGAGSLQPISNPPSSEALIGKATVNTQEYWLNGDIKWNPFTNIIYHAGFEFREKNLDEVIGYSNFDLLALFANDFPIASSEDLEFAALVTLPAEERLWGGFLGSTYEFKDMIDVSLGLRYDDFELAGEALSPRASVVFKANNYHSIKLIYGEAFRAPNAVEYFAVNNPSTLGNPNLESESVATTEAIWFYQRGSTRVQLGIFDSRFKDSIGIDVENRTRTFVNLGSSRARGVEFNWTQPLTENWAGRLMLSRLTEKPDNMFRLASNSANLLINYTFQHWIFTADIEYTGERQYLNNNQTTPVTIDDFSLFNAHLAYAINDQFSLTLTSKNLLNEQYFTPSATSSESAIPARGIETTLGLTYQF